MNYSAIKYFLTRNFLKVIALFKGKKVIRLYNNVRPEVEIYTLMDKKVLKEYAQAPAYVYPISKVGSIICFPGGGISPYSSSSYIKRWEYV